MRILVCGVPATGKSDICDEVAKREGWENVNFADLMYQLGQRRGLITRREDLASLGTKARNQLQNRTLLELDDVTARAGADKVCLIEGHLLVEQNNRYVPGIVVTPAHLEAAQIAGVAVIKSAVEDIIERRKSPRYSRNNKDKNFIEKHIVLTESAAAAFALIAGAPLFIIENNNIPAPASGVDGAAEKLMRVITELLHNR